MRMVLAMTMLVGIVVEPPADDASPAPLQLNPVDEEQGFTAMPEDEESFYVDEPEDPDTVPASESAASTPAQPTEAELQPESAGPGRRKPLRNMQPVYPPTWFSFGLGGGPSGITFSAGVTRFVIPFIGVGLEVRDDIFINQPSTFNSFQLTPMLTLMMLPRRQFSPYLRGGFGLDAYSSGLGVYGQWVGGLGFVIRFLKRFSVDIGVDLAGDVPRSSYFDNFYCDGGGEACWLKIRPSVGVGVAF